MRVLVVEDEVKLAKLVRQGLREEGLLADVAVTGEDALWMAPANSYDVLVLDLNLPGIDGLETCRRLRTDGVRTPILMLTARDRVADRVTGLDTGADDYLVKPFDFDELLAPLSCPGTTRTGGAAHPARGGRPRPGPRGARGAPRRRGDRVSTKEFQLLEVFMRHPGQALSRYALIEGGWDMEYETAPTSWMSTSATCARRSTGPSAGTASRRCAASATACATAERRRCARGRGSRHRPPDGLPCGPAPAGRLPREPRPGRPRPRS